MPIKVGKSGAETLFTLFAMLSIENEILEGGIMSRVSRHLKS